MLAPELHAVALPTEPAEPAGDESTVPSAVAGAPESPLDAAILIRGTGAVLEAWTRDNVPREVVSVMAATLVGSIEGLSTALGGPLPRRVSFATACRRFVVERMPRDTLLLLVAPTGAPTRALRNAARRARQRLAEPLAEASPPTPGSRRMREDASVRPRDMIASPLGSAMNGSPTINYQAGANVAGKSIRRFSAELEQRLTNRGKAPDNVIRRACELALGGLHGRSGCKEFENSPTP